MKKEDIIIIGYGWVGQANALALVHDGYNVAYFDVGEPHKNYKKYETLYNKVRRLNKVLEIDTPKTVYIVCVGDRVDSDGNQDISNIKKALLSLDKTQGIVVLRSTILPRYLDGLDFDIYLPEFLHEKVGVEECINPFYVVVGKKTEIANPSFIDLWRERSVKYFESSPEDASHIKYLSNLWNAIRVAFVNEYGCSIEEPSSPSAIKRIDKIMRFMFEDKPYLRYGRSYGGHCLPKDSRAYANWNKEEGKHSHLLKAMNMSNDAHKLREEKYDKLPEWFSEWQKPKISGWVALAELWKSIKRNISHPLAAIVRRRSIGKSS